MGRKRTDPTTWLVEKTGGFLEGRLTRRGFIAKTTMVGTAVAVSGCAVATQPGSPYTYVTDCAGGLCRDGYTEFCCVINQGVNACPPDTAAAGWWRADYSVFCNGTRYYIDCNNWSGAGPCRCAHNCDTRKVYCNHFRYGQCNQHIGGTGVIACRMVTCVPPYNIGGLNCSPSGAVDNATAGHNADCAAYTPPPPEPPPTPLPLLPPTGSGIVPAAGTLAAFARFPGGSVQYRAHDGSTWADWVDLGGTTTAKVEAVATGAGQMRLFVRETDRTCATRAYDGAAWSAWENLGAGLTSDPVAAVLNGDVHLLVRGGDRAIYWNRLRNGAWLGWTRLGGILTSNVSAVVRGNALWIVARGQDSAYYLNILTGSSWSGWGSMGGRFTSDPAVVVRGANDFFAFGRGRGTAEVFIQGFVGGTWSGWVSLGGATTSDPAAVVDSTNRIHLFARFPDGQLYGRQHTAAGGWAGWSALEGQLVTDPEAVADGESVSVFAVWDDDALWRRRFDGSSWTVWESLAGTVESVSGLA